MALPTVGVVSLSQGTRPDDLNRGLASLAAQTGVDLDIVVVGNAWKPVGLPPGVRREFVARKLAAHRRGSENNAIFLWSAWLLAHSGRAHLQA